MTDPLNWRNAPYKRSRPDLRKSFEPLSWRFVMAACCWAFLYMVFNGQLPGG